jgi:hypothetical protein
MRIRFWRRPTDDDRWVVPGPAPLERQAHPGDYLESFENMPGSQRDLRPADGVGDRAAPVDQRRLRRDAEGSDGLG